jgi:hypothetical protein
VRDSNPPRRIKSLAGAGSGETCPARGPDGGAGRVAGLRVLPGSVLDCLDCLLFEGNARFGAVALEQVLQLV